MYTHHLVKTFEKNNLNIRYMKWIPTAYLMTIYNDQMRKGLNKKEVSEKEEPTKFECFFSKFPKTYKKNLRHDYVLIALSANYGILFVDFIKEGIVQMDHSSPNVSAFDLVTNQTAGLKQTLICHGSKSGAVEFNYCDSELRYKDKLFESDHSGSVSCILFSKMQDGLLKCASGSYDRFINLYAIKNFDSKEFNPAVDIQLYCKLK
jgi:hypothetical protein